MYVGFSLGLKSFIRSEVEVPFEDLKQFYEVKLSKTVLISQNSGLLVSQSSAASGRSRAPLTASAAPLARKRSAPSRRAAAAAAAAVLLNQSCCPCY